MTQLRNKRPATSFFPSYDAHSRINTKLHNVHGGWSKMVASINHMSLERAESFVHRFPAPGLFFEELEQAVQEEEVKEKDSGKRKKGQGTDGECWVMRQTARSGQEGATVRPIQQALSTQIWHLFTDTSYPKAGKGSAAATD